MSVAPHAGIVDFGTFTSPSTTVDGIQGEVPQPLAGQQNYVLTANGFVPGGSIPGLGTMATQNANAVAITGGTINGTTIGATTPATGKFSTLEATGNTDLGTGSANYIDVSGGATTVAPVISAQGTDTNINLNLTAKGTGSVNLRTNTGTQLQVQDATGLTVDRPWLVRGGQVFALASVITGYAPRFQASSDESFAFNTNSGTSGAVGGSTQFQIAHTASAVNYVQVTGAATGGDPVVSAQGSDTNIDLALQPKGTGALQAQATTSTTAGGNARGANAVDWQTTRGSAANVASGSQSVVGGGINNTSSNFYSSVLGGANNIASGNASFVGGGNTNTAGARDWSTVVGGYSNTAAGFYNFIGGGFTNSGTASAAVTTQSGTMNATTAVTLSGSNANIKVGQYISGTSIANDTYVAAISGTSLTLSKVASGSSTSTLSFFTPHGVVVGGGNNQATGSYSFIGGGGDAGSSANRNVASGDWSVVAGGFKNTATNLYDTVAGGFTNAASGSYCFIGGGQNQTVSGSNASVLGGRNNNCNAGYGSIVAGLGAFSKGICGVAQSGANYFSVVGDAQSATYVLSITTTNATATALTTNQSAASTLNQVILPNNQAYAFTGVIVARNTSTNDVSAWEVKGAIKRGANAAATALVGTPTVTSIGVDAGAATWVLAITADTTNGGISIKGTGVAATTIRWVAQITTAEVG